MIEAKQWISCEDVLNLIFKLCCDEIKFKLSWKAMRGLWIWVWQSLMNFLYCFFFCFIISTCYFRYWLCAAFGPSIKIWDLESKEMVDELRPDVVTQTNKAEPQCLSLAWSTDGQTLFAGYSDNIIRVWQVGISTR